MAREHCEKYPRCSPLKESAKEEIEEAKEKYDATKAADAEKYEEDAERIHEKYGQCGPIKENGERQPPCEQPKDPTKKREELARAKEKYKDRLARAEEHYKARVEHIHGKHGGKTERYEEEEQKEREELEHEEPERVALTREKRQSEVIVGRIQKKHGQAGKPLIKHLSAAHITKTSAVLSVTVDPEELATTYELWFLYPCAHSECFFERVLAEGAIASTRHQLSVSVREQRLYAGGTFGYWIIASNSAGIVEEFKQFKTLGTFREK